MKYISIDVETLGTDPETCSLIELAAVIDDCQSPLEELKTFNVVVLHRNYSGQPYAMEMHAKTGLLEKLYKGPDFESLVFVSSSEKDGVDYVAPHRLYSAFCDWLFESGIKYQEKLVPAGKNLVGFDFKFLEKIGFHLHKFTNRTLDPGPMWALPTDERPPSLVECLKRSGVEKTVSHCALDDCFDVIKCIRAKWGVPF